MVIWPCRHFAHFSGGVVLDLLVCDSPGWALAPPAHRPTGPPVRGLYHAPGESTRFVHGACSPRPASAASRHDGQVLRPEERARRQRLAEELNARTAELAVSHRAERELLDDRDQALVVMDAYLASQTVPIDPTKIGARLARKAIRFDARRGPRPREAHRPPGRSVATVAGPGLGARGAVALARPSASRLPTAGLASSSRRHARRPTGDGHPRGLHRTRMLITANSTSTSWPPWPTLASVAASLAPPIDHGPPY
jgi:hypothetical protein